MRITRQSIITGNVSVREIPVTSQQIDRYYSQHLLVHQAFPHLSADDREFILSGITPEEWEKFIKDNNEEQDNYRTAEEIENDECKQ